MAAASATIHEIFEDIPSCAGHQYFNPMLRLQNLPSRTSLFAVEGFFNGNLDDDIEASNLDLVHELPADRRARPVPVEDLLNYVAKRQANLNKYRSEFNVSNK